MFRRLIVLVFFVFCCAAFSHAADTYNEYTGQGLFINSTPTGAKVFIDGVERGVTPFTITAIKEGRHKIKIQKDDFESRFFDVIVRDGTRIEMIVDIVESKGRVELDIKKDPSASSLFLFDPRIMVDGKVIQENPIALTSGWRTITIEAFGWEKFRQNILVTEGSDQTIECILKPADFIISDAALQRKHINPHAAGTSGNTRVSFSVSAPGRGLLEVLDEKKNVICRSPLGPFIVWRQKAVWDGKQIIAGNDGSIEWAAASDGNYTIKITVWNSEAEARQSVEFVVTVDSSLELRPLTASSSVPGLLFAASAETLPALSFQIQADILAGKPLLQESWKGLPFALSFRFSLRDNLELDAAFNANPRFYEDSEWGGGASIKWQFYNHSGKSQTVYNPLSAALALSYGWASSGPYTVFGMGTGAALRLPVSYAFFRSKTPASSFALLVSPVVLWTGEKGYPTSPIPRLGIEGGVLYTYNSISAGVSVRWDYALHSLTDSSIDNSDAGSHSGAGPLATALELKWHPANFYLSLTGGYWQWNNSPGAFFGLGMGIVY